MRLVGGQGHEEVEERHRLAADAHFDGQVEPVTNRSRTRQADYRGLGRLSVLGGLAGVLHDDPGDGFKFRQHVGEEAHGGHPAQGCRRFEPAIERRQQLTNRVLECHSPGAGKRLQHRRFVGAAGRVPEGLGCRLTRVPREPSQVDSVALKVPDPQDQRLVGDLGQCDGPVARAHSDPTRQAGVDLGKEPLPGTSRDGDGADGLQLLEGTGGEPVGETGEREAVPLIVDDLVDPGDPVSRVADRQPWPVGEWHLGASDLEVRAQGDPLAGLARGSFEHEHGVGAVDHGGNAVAPGADERDSQPLGLDEEVPDPATGDGVEPDRLLGGVVPPVGGEVRQGQNFPHESDLVGARAGAVPAVAEGVDVPPRDPRADPSALVAPDHRPNPDPGLRLVVRGSAA